MQEFASHCAPEPPQVPLAQMTVALWQKLGHMMA